MYNWYYFYNKTDINEEDLNNLSSRLEELGYRFYQPMGLGAGPSPEEVILWISNNQLLSTITLNLLTSFIYDVLKKVWSWYKTPKLKNNKIPVVEIFIKFKDNKKVMSDIRVKFRIDKELDKKDVENIIKLYLEDNKKSLF